MYTPKKITSFNLKENKDILNHECRRMLLLYFNQYKQDNPNDSGYSEKFANFKWAVARLSFKITEDVKISYIFEEGFFCSKDADLA